MEHRKGDVATEQPGRGAELDLLPAGEPAALAVDQHLGDVVARLAQTGRDRGAGLERDLVLEERPPEITATFTV